ISASRYLIKQTPSRGCVYSFPRTSPQFFFKLTLISQHSTMYPSSPLIDCFFLHLLSLRFSNSLHGSQLDGLVTQFDIRRSLEAPEVLSEPSFKVLRLTYIEAASQFVQCVDSRSI